jgi:transcriptional regulator with XRE-family HTH domain
MIHTTRQRLISLAVQHYGREELARRLKTSPTAIDAWDSGKGPIPSAKLLALIDLLDELDALGAAPAKPRR